MKMVIIILIMKGRSKEITLDIKCKMTMIMITQMMVMMLMIVIMKMSFMIIIKRRIMVNCSDMPVCANPEPEIYGVSKIMKTNMMVMMLMNEDGDHDPDHEHGIKENNGDVQTCLCVHRW